MNLKRFFPYVVSIGIFVIASLVYFSPVLKGEKMSQSDITQFKGMAKEINDFRESTGEEPYWTGSAFSGMPAYQLSAYYPNDYITHLDKVLRFLPRPADYLFLYFLGFFLLLTALKTDWKLSLLGALGFGFSTYLIIIFGAGHNAKAHAIGYIPFVLAGITWVFRCKYLLGFIVIALAMALEIKANHPQMTYYLFFLILILGVVEFIDAIKRRSYKVFGTQIGLILLASIIGLGMNSSRLMAMKEYGDVSTRGKSELTINPDGTEKESTSGLSKEYITQYSYGIAETFNLMIPRYMGGGTVESLGENSNFYEVIEDAAGKSQARAYSENVLTYWGNQPIIEAPAYIGAVLFFLFFLGVFLVKGKLKQWLVAATIFSILMSWGKNFAFLTEFFIDYVPLYNKFRAVSSIQIIAEVCVPLLAILGLREFFANNDEFQRKEALKKAFYVSGGIVLIAMVYALSFSTFEGIRDNNYAQIPGLLDAVIADRKQMLYTDSFRSMILIGIAFTLLWLFLKNKLNKTKALIGFGIIILFDLITVDYKYVNKEDFQPARKIENPFVASQVDNQILQDKTHYRVANFTGNLMEEGRTSYFHKSIGGYHAAKMGRYDDLIDFQIRKNNIEVFNMLNTKYFILSDKEGQQRAELNPEVNGSVWFVNKLIPVQSANEEILALDSLKTKNEAVIDWVKFGSQFKPNLGVSFEKDSTANIELIDYKTNHLTYKSITSKVQFAVFSEIYYQEGWQAYIDSKPVSHVRVNYILRGMKLPIGEHTIEFKFEPRVIYQGKTITLISYSLLLIVLLGWFVYKIEKLINKYLNILRI